MRKKSGEVLLILCIIATVGIAVGIVAKVANGRMGYDGDGYPYKGPMMIGTNVVTDPRWTNE